MRELAKKVGVSYPYLSKLENGIENNPSDDLIMSLSKVLNIDIVELYIKAHRIPLSMSKMIINNEQLFNNLLKLTLSEVSFSVIETLNSNEEKSIYAINKWLSFTNKIALLISYDTGNVINVSNAALDFYGYSKEELLGLNLFEMFAHKSSNLKLEMEKAINNNQSVFACTHPTKGGVEKNVVIVTESFYIATKSYIMATVLDLGLVSGDTIFEHTSKGINE